MGWKIVRNDQPPYKEILYSGECPRFHKQVTVTGGYYKEWWAKTDLQPTYPLRGYSCTLLAGSGEDGLCPWASQCPFMPPKFYD